MNECQVWWTLTGNFGNMMPIDWSKTYTRAQHLPTLNLCAPRPVSAQEPAVTRGGQELAEEDDIVAADLDMHQLILQSDNLAAEAPIRRRRLSVPILPARQPQLRDCVPKPPLCQGMV